jgi:acetate---CoA ligase (ADP-forming)
MLTGRESKAVLSLYGIRTPREILAPSFEDAVVAANEIGYPVVLKAEAPDLVRKTEAGAIMLDVADEATLRRCFKRVLTNAWGAVPAFSVSGVLVQERINGNAEIAVRMSQAGEAAAIPQEFAWRFAELCHDLRDLVEEIEVDPVIVDAEGACAVDCVIVPAM